MTGGLQIFQAIGSGSKLSDADLDTLIQLEESADEDIIRMDVAGTEAFHLSAIGELTLAKQSAARAYKGDATQTISTGTVTVVSVSVENYDIQNEFDLDTERFTATEAGKYYISASVAYATPVADKVYMVRIHVNEAAVSISLFHSSSTTAIYVQTSDTIHLAAGDFVELATYHEAGANDDVALSTSPGVYSFLSIIRVA